MPDDPIRRHGATMKLDVDVQPWSTPNYVIAKMAPRPRQEGLTCALSWSLNEVDPELLSKLCDEFRADIFRKAGRVDPRKAANA